MLVYVNMGKKKTELQEFAEWKGVPQPKECVRCPECGKYYTIGEWVFCPHGKMGTYGFTVQGGTGKFHR